MSQAPGLSRAYGLAIRSSDAAYVGVSRGELRSDAFYRARHGVYVPRSAPASDPDTRIAVAAAALPASAALGGWAAARLHEMTRPGRGPGSELTVFDGHLPWPPGRRELDDLLICAPRSARIAQPPATRVFRSDFDDDESQMIEGVRVTSPLRTAFDIARLSTYETAVVALDRLRSLELLDAGELSSLIELRRGWTGRDRARRALRDSANRVESPRESLLRILWLGTGLGRPITNPVLRTVEGEFLARVDMLDPDFGIVGEYDGAVHADADRRSDDARRQELLQRAGLRVIRATSTDLGTGAARASWQGRLRRIYTEARRDRRRANWVIATG